MKCDPTLYRGAPPSLAVKPRLLRHWLLPPLIILLTIGLGYAGYRVSEHFGIRALSEWLTETTDLDVTFIDIPNPA